MKAMFAQAHDVAKTITGGGVDEIQRPEKVEVGSFVGRDQLFQRSPLRVRRGVAEVPFQGKRFSTPFRPIDLPLSSAAQKLFHGTRLI